MELLHLCRDTLDDFIIDLLQVDEDPVVVLCKIYIGVPEQSKDVPVFIPAQTLGLSDEVVPALHDSKLVCRPRNSRLFMSLCVPRDSCR